MSDKQLKKASELWDIPAEAYDAAEHLLNEMDEEVKGDEQEELWDEVGAIVHGFANYNLFDHVMDNLKSKYTITRNK